jgi:hypothetical protein
VTETLHRILMALGGTLAGVAGLLGGTNLVSPEIMSYVALGGGIAILVANQIRVYWPATAGTADTTTVTTTTTPPTPPAAP